MSSNSNDVNDKIQRDNIETHNRDEQQKKNDNEQQRINSQTDLANKTQAQLQNSQSSPIVVIPTDEDQEDTTQVFDEHLDVETEQYEVKPVISNDKDWKLIVDAYKKEYPKNEIKDNLLTFPSPENAISFFKQQAKDTPPRKFFASEFANGKSTGNHVFSCGSGTLYKGSLDDIQKQLASDLAAKSNDPDLKAGMEQINRIISTNKTREFRLQREDLVASQPNDTDHNQSTAEDAGTAPQQTP